jgi:hypothetical protein
MAATAIKKAPAKRGAPSSAPPVAGELANARATRAHRESVKAFGKIVEALVGYVGAQLVAYIGGVSETRAVRQWIAGEREAHPSTRSKLQLALNIAGLLDQAGEGDAIEAWFQGLNPSLDDHAPAELLRDAEGTKLTSTGRRILAAAREFADS